MRTSRIPLPLRAVTILMAAAAAAGCGDDDARSGPPPRVLVQALGGDEVAEDATFAGLVTEVSNWLTYAPDVVVRRPGRTPAERSGAAELASAVDADHVLWVSLRPAANGRMVRWELQDVHDAEALGGDSLRMDVEELPEAPRRIALDALGALGLPAHRSGWAESRPLAPDPAAYERYLQVLGAKVTEADLHVALASRAEALEPLVSAKLDGYAPAMTLAGGTYLDLAGLVGGQAPHYGRAEATLERAVQVDPLYPPARSSLASYLAKVGRSEEAVELLVLGVSAHPHYADYHEKLGYVLRYAGLMDASMASYRRAQQLDGSHPNMVSTQDQITKSLIYKGDYDAALVSHMEMQSHLDAMGRRADEKQWFYEGVIHLYRKDPNSALAAFETGALLDSTSVWTTFGRAYSAMILDDVRAIRATLDALEDRDVVDGERHYRLVHFAVAAGDTARALDHLHRSVEGGFFNVPYLRSDPLTAPIHQSPRFQEILAAAQVRHDEVRALAARVVTLPEPSDVADAARQSAGTLVVLNKGAATATFVDVASGAILGTLPTGEGPHELAMTRDGRWAVSTDYNDGNSLTVFDVAGMAVARTVDLSAYPRPHGAFFLPGDSVLAVTSEATGNVVLVQPFRGEIVGAIPTESGGSHMVAVTGDGATLFTGDMQSNTVSALDVATRTRTAGYPVPPVPEAITVSRDGRQVWVGSNEEGTVSVVDTDTGAVTSPLTGFSWPYRILIVEERDLVVIPDLRHSHVRFVSYGAQEDLGTLDLPGEGPQGVALNGDRSTLFLSLSEAGQVAVIDLATREVVRRIDVGPTPDGIGWSPLVLR